MSQNDNLVKFGIVPVFWVGLLAVILLPLSIVVSILIAKKTPLHFGDVWLVSLCVMLIGLVVFAFLSIRGKRGVQAILYAAETLTGVDINKDGAVGNPKSFVVEVKEGSRITYIFGATEEQWKAFVDEMVNGNANTSESHWCGAGKPFDKATFNEFRDELIRLGHARWKSPKHHAQGWKLTAGGEVLMRVSAKEMGL